MNEGDEGRAEKGLLVYSGSGLWLCHKQSTLPSYIVLDAALSDGPNLESSSWIKSVINVILMGLDTVSL